MKMIINMILELAANAADGVVGEFLAALKTTVLVMALSTLEEDYEETPQVLEVKELLAGCIAISMMMESMHEEGVLDDFASMFEESLGDMIADDDDDYDDYVM